jgi:periplasmic copper chaperone A
VIDLTAVNSHRLHDAPLARRPLAVVAALALAFSVASCGDDDAGNQDTVTPSADVTITDAWVRQPAEGQTVSAAYGTITNGGDDDITLVGASVPIQGTVEIHETMMGDDGSMSMQERTEGFVVPAGGTFMLAPGGPHVMIMDIEPAEVTGTIDVTFIFDNGLEVTVPAEVRMLDAGAMGEMGDMDGDMDGDTGDMDGEMDEMGS